MNGKESVEVMKTSEKAAYLIMPSTLTLPGPQNKMVRKAARNKVAFSACPNMSYPCAIAIATDMLMIRGITASLVNSPAIKKIAQKNSAKMVRESDRLLPMPMKLMNCDFI